MANLDGKNTSLLIITVIHICIFNILSNVMAFSFLIAVKNIVRYNYYIIITERKQENATKRRKHL